MSPEILVEDQTEVHDSPLAAATAVRPAVKSLPRENPQGMPKLGYKAQAQKGFNWFTTGFMILFHVCAIAALFMFTWKALICALVLWVLATNVGIGMCYHRLLTHRGYRVPKWLEYVMAVCGTMALEGGPIFWVSLHRVHHQLTDHEGDPHTPHEGGWWAHAGWILIGDSLNSETDALARYVPDLTRDRFHSLAEQVSLGSAGHRCRGALLHRRLAVRSVGHLPAHHFGPARHLAGQLGHAHVGIAPL